MNKFQEIYIVKKNNNSNKNDVREMLYLSGLDLYHGYYQFHDRICISDLSTIPNQLQTIRDDMSFVCSIDR